jgi:type I restriction enzyme S subunit
VYDEGLSLDDVVYINAETDEEMEESRIRGGDILLNITGASLGRTCLVPTDFVRANVNQHVCIVRLNDTSLREFVSMFLKSSWIKAQIDAAQTGAAREGLNFAQVSRLALTIPPVPERILITSFLDRETTKIDSLVAEQQQLIEQLKEKRQAVISHAVTKGLNPQAPMKSSGIEWLGDLPRHWDVKRLKYISPEVTVGIVVEPSKLVSRV